MAMFANGARRRMLLLAMAAQAAALHGQRAVAQAPPLRVLGTGAVEHPVHDLIAGFTRLTGRVVEQADVDTLFHAPRHPYTRALLACAINLEDDRNSALEPIAGAPPDPRRRPSGCPFHPRCPDAIPDCRRVDPPLEAVSAQQSVACIVAQRAMADA